MVGSGEWQVVYSRRWVHSVVTKSVEPDVQVRVAFDVAVAVALARDGKVLLVVPFESVTSLAGTRTIDESSNTKIVIMI